MPTEIYAETIQNIRGRKLKIANLLLVKRKSQRQNYFRRLFGQTKTEKDKVYDGQTKKDESSVRRENDNDKKKNDDHDDTDISNTIIIIIIIIAITFI